MTDNKQEEIKTQLTPKEVKVIHMALEVFIEDNINMRTDPTIPFNAEARMLMKDLFETASSALKKIQLTSGYAVQLDPYNEGDEEEFLTKQS